MFLTYVRTYVRTYMSLLESRRVRPLDQGFGSRVWGLDITTTTTATILPPPPPPPPLRTYVPSSRLHHHHHHLPPKTPPPPPPSSRSRQVAGVAAPAPALPGRGGRRPRAAELHLQERIALGRRVELWRSIRTMYLFLYKKTYVRTYVRTYVGKKPNVRTYVRTYSQ